MPFRGGYDVLKPGKRQPVRGRRFVAEARKDVPERTVDDDVPGPPCIRAQALDRDGSLVDDFRVTRRSSILAVRNAPRRPRPRRSPSPSTSSRSPSTADPPVEPLRMRSALSGSRPPRW